MSGCCCIVSRSSSCSGRSACASKRAVAAHWHMRSPICTKRRCTDTTAQDACVPASAIAAAIYSHAEPFACRGTGAAHALFYESPQSTVVVVPSGDLLDCKEDRATGGRVQQRCVAAVAQQSELIHLCTSTAALGVATSVYHAMPRRCAQPARRHPSACCVLCVVLDGVCTQGPHKAAACQHALAIAPGHLAKAKLHGLTNSE